MNNVLDNDNSASKVIAESTCGPLNELPSTDVKCKDIIPKANTNSSPSISSKPGESKRLIRRFTKLDSKKLQQLGLDRKIAEALSHQKSMKEQESKATKESPTRELIGITVAAAITRSSVEKISPLAKSSDYLGSDVKSLNELPVTDVTASITDEKSTSKSTTPPKITITGPESPLEYEEEQLQNLSAQQRLENVKQLLSKKIMKKHTKEASPVAAGGKPSFVHLKSTPVHDEIPKTADIKAPTQKTPKTASTKIRSSNKESLPVVSFLLKNNLSKPVVRPQSPSPSSEMCLKNHSHSKLVLIPKATIRSTHQHSNQRRTFSPINVSKEQTADNSENKCSEATAINSPTASCNSVPKSLIVLENKVLSQHEMIDLTSLGLSTSKVANEGFSQPHKPIPEVMIKQEQPDDFPPLPSNATNQLNVHPLPIKTNRKSVNTKKLKSSSEKSAPSSKQTQSKSLEKPLTKDPDIFSTSSKAGNETSPVAIEKSSLKNCSQKIASKPEKQSLIKAVSKPSLTSSPSKETNVSANSMESEIETLVPFTKSASVEIVNEPEMNDTFSAVDFIASLSNMSQSMTEKSSMELSQEELNLNASCSSNMSSATHKISTSYKTGAESAKSSLSIGKIVTIPKENILKLNPSNLNAIVIASCNGPETIVTKSTEVTITTPNQKLQSMPIKVLNKSANVRKETPKAATINRVKKTVFKSDSNKLRKEMFECLNIKVKETREPSIHEPECGNEKSSKSIEFSKHSDDINVNQEPDKSLPKEKVEKELQKLSKPSMPSISETNMNVIPEIIQGNQSQAKKLDALSKIAEQNDERSPKMTYVQNAAVNIDAPKSLGRFKKSKANLISTAKPCSDVPKSEEDVNHETKDLTCTADGNIHQPVTEIIRKIEDFANQAEDNRPVEVISVVSPSSEKRLIKELNINQSEQVSRNIAATALETDDEEKTHKSCGLNASGEPLEDAGRENAEVLKLQTGLNVNENIVGRMPEEVSNGKEKTVSEISKVGLSLKAKKSNVTFAKEPSVSEATPNVSEGADPGTISDPPQAISNSKLNAKQSKEAKDKFANGNSALSDIKLTKTAQKNQEKKSSPSVALPLTKSPLKRKRPDIETSANEPIAIASVTHRGKKSNQLKLSECVKSEEKGEEKKKDDEEESLLEPLRVEEFNEYSCKEKNFLNSNKHPDDDSNCVARRSKLGKARSAEAEEELKNLKKMETIGPLSIKVRKGTKHRKELEIEEKKTEIDGNVVKSGEKPSNRRSSQRKAILEFKEDKSSANNTECAVKESINYEDLEFLPVNAEIQDFEPLRAKRKIAKKHRHVSKENSTQAKNKKTDNSSREAVIESPQSKRRRKTLETEAVVHKVLIDSDNEYEGGEISFDGSPEFLGFDDSFEVGLELKEDDNKFKNMERKQTTLRDWLTTGKNTSSPAPTEEKPCSSRNIPLKKRWDLNMTSRDQTDVHDDEISSADENEVKIKKRKVENLLVTDRKKFALGKNQIEKPEENESLTKPLSANDSEAKACLIVQNVKDIPLPKLKSTNSRAQNSTNVKPPQKSISQMSVKDSLQKTFTSNVNAEREAKSLEKKSDEKPDNSRLKCEAKTASKVEENDLQFSKISSPTKIKNHSSDSPASVSIKSEPNTSTGATIPVKRSRGRKLGAVPNLENNFNPRLLLATNRSEVDSDEVLTCDAETIGSGPIQCGLCLKRTSSQKWLPHLSEHYGFGFKLGEKELNACNRSIVLSQIISYFKETNIKGLCCRMCQKMYRSGLGLLMHIEGCGITQERVICEFCKRDYSKLSLNPHLRTCAQRLRLENPNVEENEKKPNLTVEETFSNTGRLKRVSTIKAESKLKIIGEHLGRNGNEENNSEFDAKTHVRYHPPMDENYRQKCSDDLNTFGKAFCPKKICRFTSDNIDELEKHINTCKHITKSGYYCCFCKMRRFETESLAIKHIEQCHKPKVEESDNSDCNIRTDEEDSSDDDNNSISEDVDENEDNLEENSTKKSAKKNSKMKPVKTGSERNKVFPPRSHEVGEIVINKWKNFLEINYSLTPLFSKFSSKFKLGNFSELSNSFPRQKTSMKFSFLKDMKLLSTIGQPKKDMEWSELKRFENVENESDIFFFLGAPVKIVAWVPLPHDVSEQYLAVVYRKDIFKYTRFSEPKRHNTLLLLFKVLQIESEKVSHLQLHYGVNITDGPIHNISFIPSGGYNADDNRLALVAVGGVESTIKVYALPLKIATNVDEAEPIVIEIESSFILKCGLNDEDHIMYKTQCLQICWSEVKGHNHIFAAYSNGCIGIWDISDDMQGNLNCFLIDNVHHYVPLNYWYVGEKDISIHYDTNGPRWLAVSGMLRRFAVFDIQNIMQPTIVRDELNKNIVRAMDWCPVWETIVLAICDSMPNNGRCALIVNPLSVMFAHNKLDIMSSAVTQVHYTPLTNLCVCSTDNGDLLFLNPRELHYEQPLGKQFGYPRRFLTTMDVKTLNGDPLVKIDKSSTSELPNDWNMYEKNYKYKYGVVFGSIFPLKAAHKNAYLDENRRPPLHITPLMRINTLRCNLNPNGKHLTAVGYENGFVRIVNFQKDTESL
ncbi:uncharacterized protein LOC119631312 isoform X2 [Glossina fuscipes]|uniref:Uncharacterized protein LOC119631312 isoform X2 n=1 Tax=Glossina fuscipes TaxID=7396 RepID=A0A8U0W2A6_9MUSC|nr:uncharacterized protein LOC119631312 isoform X2 [Glossina fuscipes]